MARISYEERLNKAENPLLKKLLTIMIEKKTNLCVAANFEKLEEILKYVDKCGKHICILKIQCNGIDESREEVLSRLYEKKLQHNFLIFTDDKFSDCPAVTSKYYQKKFVKYVDILTLYPYHDDFITEIEKVAKNADLPETEYRGCMAVCDTSYGFEAGDPIKLLEIASRHEFCLGIISQKLQVKDSTRMVKASPGVHLNLSTDGKQQNWNHPKKVVDNGADIVIVGRGITSAPEEEQEKVTLLYKEASYQAYLDSLEGHK